MKNTKLIIAGVVAIVAIGAIFAFSGKSNSEAQGILNDAIGNQSDLHSISFIGDLRVFATENEEEKGALAIKIRGDADSLQNPEEIRTQMNIDITDEGLVSIASGADIKISIKAIGQTGYFRLDDLVYENLPFDLSGILKQWIKIENFEEQAQGLAGSTALTGTSAQISEAQFSEIRALIRKSEILEVTEDLGKAEGGQYHFAYRVNQKNLLKFIKAVSEIVQEDGQKLSKEEQEQVDVAIEQLYGVMQITGEIWIQENGAQIAKTSINIAMPPSEEVPVELAIAGEFEVLNFNEEMEIEAPESSISFEEAFGLVMQSMFSATAVPTE